MSEDLLSRRFRAAAAELKETRHAVRDTLAEAGVDDTDVQDCVLALDEACQNVIRHAYGPDREGDIALTITREGEHLIFHLTDWAPRIDPSEVEPRDLDDLRPGGLGTHLIREVMDEADFVEPPPGCGNLLRMRKRIGEKEPG